MARFEPFRGTTYRADIPARDVLAPPYDVVDPSEREVLASRSPYNSILVELPLDRGGGDRYAHAASLFGSWHDEGVVKVSDEPVFYVYRMTFTEEDGTVRATTGVLGALFLDPYQRGDVLPHEQTTSKDKTDRLSLLGAARANFSPIWGLSLAAGLGKLCAGATSAGETFGARDDDGVLHERWVVASSELIEEISALVASAPVLVADGHHRYETACAYLAGEGAGTRGADAILAFVVELAEDELAVQGIHRLVEGVPAAAVLEGLERWFEPSPGPDDPGLLAEAMLEAGGLGLVMPDRNLLLVARPELLASVADDLDTSRLGFALEASLPGAKVSFQHGIGASRAAVLTGRASAAVLVRPVSIEQIESTANGGRRMPPKSTFFHPKPRTGAVFRELDAS